MTQRNYCFDIEPAWGSHSSMLEFEVSSLLPSDRQLVIEHGAGMYSSPVIARYPVRVLCIEEAPGWKSWAEWLYRKSGRDVQMLDRAKQCRSLLAEASLVFIDGAARERGDLLKWALDAGVPTIIAHDTEEGGYGYRLDSRADYVIDSDNGRPGTTRWRKVTPL